MYSFLLDSQPGLTTAGNADLSSSTHGLDHLAGADLSTCDTTAPKYTFEAKGTVSKVIAKSYDLLTKRNAFLGSKLEEVATYFASHGGPEHTFVWSWPGSSSFELKHDPDLFFAYHDYDFDLTVIATVMNDVCMTVKSLNTTGTVYDLYDFNYEKELLPPPLDFIHKAAMVEIGWRAQSSHASGRIFFDPVLIDTRRNTFKNFICP